LETDDISLRGQY